MIDEDVERKVAPVTRIKRRPSVSSGDRGRPLADLLARFERDNPIEAAKIGLSSADLRATALVREMRKAKGFSQEVLAKKIGVTQERISEIERGIGPQGPTFGLLSRIASACGMKIVAVPDTKPELSDREVPKSAKRA